MVVKPMNSKGFRQLTLWEFGPEKTVYRYQKFEKERKIVFNEVRVDHEGDDEEKDWIGGSRTHWDPSGG